MYFKLELMNILTCTMASYMMEAALISNFSKIYQNGFKTDYLKHSEYFR